MLSLQQLDEILSSYVQTGVIPEWIREAMPEFDFVYKRDFKTNAFFNTAIELKDIALFEQKEHIDVDDLIELQFTRIPDNTILHVMEKAYLLERDGARYKFGKLINQLVSIRMAGYPLNSPELLQVHREILGVLAIAITKALIEDFKAYIPRGALALFKILSAHMREHENEEEISRIINRECQNTGFNIIPRRQARHMKYYMNGFYDGSTRILTDVDDEGSIICKPSITIYLNRMRERLRERQRDRERA